MRRIASILFCAYFIALTFAVLAKASPMPKNWHAQSWWLNQAMCIHGKEGALNAFTGNGYAGGWQFLLSTWQSVDGPTVLIGKIVHWADVASPREQLYRAWLVWNRDGGSWREWGTAYACGLR